MLNSESDNGVKQWHLVKPSESENQEKKGDGERDHKMMAEIYLPRLLTTKVGQGLKTQFSIVCGVVCVKVNWVLEYCNLMDSYHR